MKQILYTLLCSLLFIGYSNKTIAQSTDCFNSNLSPFCSGIAQYPANFDSTGSGAGPQAPNGPNYDCLGTVGNPSYFSLTIERNGNIDFTLDNSANVDIDFILWGPFVGTTAAQNSCDSMGQGGSWGNVADCSYSASSQEQVVINGAQAGEVYILMVTNYANTPTNIFSTSNTGSGSIACPCDIPFNIDTLSLSAGNQGYLADTINGVNQFVVCPNNTLGFRSSSVGNFADTLSLYGPFTSVNSAFTNNTIVAFFPRGAAHDSIDIYTFVTPTIQDIGLRNFSIGMRNKLNTGGRTDSSCYDQVQMQVVIPGVSISDRMVCSGESFQVQTDSILTTRIGASSYIWTQLSGPTVSFNSTTARNPIITIPTTAATSSNDSIIIKVDYQYGNLCGMSDTMVLRFQDVNLLMSATTDTVCSGQTTILSAVLSDTLAPNICNDYLITSIPFAPVTGTGTALTLSDDQVTSSLPIGFNFDFYCNTYSNFVISSNGFISFDLNATPALSAEQIPFSNPFGGANDLIALCWTDNNPSLGGTIEYLVTGTAPNRRLIVTFTNVSLYGSTTLSQTAQAVLYESTNVIELHITSVSSSSIINNFTIGIENATGTIAHTPAGTNASSTTVTNTSYRFTPRTNNPLYTWTPANGLVSATITNPTATVNTTTTYTAVVNDGVCSYSSTKEIVALTPYAAPVLTCDSATLTSLSFSWTNIGLPATGFYEYSTDSGVTWVNVAQAQNATATSLNSNTAYSIMVRGNDGLGGRCGLSLTGSTNCTTLNPNCLVNPPVVATLTATSLLCNGDSTACVSVAVTGGSGNPIDIAWSTGTHNIDSICNLPAGTYTVIATDTFSTGGSTIVYCVDSTSIIITEPTFVVAVVDSFHNPICPTSGDGAVFITVTGGTAAYTYLWNNGTTLEDAIALNNGLQSVVVSDANGCTATTQQNLTAPNSILVVADSTHNNSCNGVADGDAFITVTGGTGTYTYNWSTGATTQDLLNAVNGVHTVTATDANGCSNTVSTTIVPNLLLISVATVTNPLCSGQQGSASLAIQNGSGSYTYNWGAASSSTTNTASTLNGGSYVVTITDNNNICTLLDTVVLTTPSALLSTIISIDDIDCPDPANSGAIDMTATGGTAAYTYNWSTGATTEDLANLAGGTYDLTVTDANGCTVTNSLTVLEVQGVSVSINTLTGTLPCNRSATGQLEAVPTGGSSFRYDWSNGATTATISTLPVGTYQVVVSNNFDCKDSITATIVAAVIPTLNASITTVTGTVRDTIKPNINTRIYANGGTGQTYSWSATTTGAGNIVIADPLAANSLVSPDMQGTYMLSVVSNITTNGVTCTVMDTVWLTVEPDYIGMPTAFTPNGDGNNDMFRPVTLRADEIITFRIYNRFGQMVYMGDDLKNGGWDGSYNGVPQPRDVYIYVLEYKKASEPVIRDIRGECTLLR